MVNPVRNKHGPFKEETEPKRNETKQMERNETIHNVFWLLAAFLKCFVLFVVVLLLCLMDSVWHGEDEA